MPTTSTVHDRGIAEVVMDNPPVNALTVAGWFELADLMTALGRDPAVRVVVLRAEGRGFNAGVDIKEMQATDGFEALIGANRGCFAAFAAVYECPVPVIAAVHGYCLGGGIGLVGNADVIVAADDATFGLPEVDRGALGAATHLSRLVPQHKMRAMVYTSATATAQELHHFGSVHSVVPADVLRTTALDLAEQIAAKSPTVIRAAKESLNGIDLWDVKRSYRYEQGFTFELNLSGVADEHRDAFVDKRDGHGHLVPDKRCTEEEAVAELRSGMTIGIGGWGSRRKPMSVVRALLRTDVTDLTVVSWGGPDVGLLCAAGKVKRLVYAFVSLDSIPLEPHFRAARQTGGIEDEPYDEGMFLLGLQAAAWRVPFLPTRVGLGSDILRDNDRVRMVTSPFEDGEELVAVPALRMDAAFVHMNRADERGNGQYLGPDPYMDDLFLGAADRRFLSAERIVPTEDLAKEGPPQSLLISRLLVDGVIEAPNGAHFTSCDPDYPRDEAFQKQYAGSAKSPEAWADFQAAWLDLSEADYQAKLRVSAVSQVDSLVERADVCVVAMAECFRGDGEILANPIGTIPMIGGRLARATFEPDLAMTDGEARLIANDEAFEWPNGKVVEHFNPYRLMFGWVWNGRRHVVMGGSQIDQYGNQNFAAIGDYRQPKVQLLGYRGAPGNTINDTTSYWVPSHSSTVLVPKVDTVCGVGYDRAAAVGQPAARFHEIRFVVTNLAVLDFATPDHRMRIRSVHPGVSVDEVQAATGFELTVPDEVPMTRLPTPEELELIDTVIDPTGQRFTEVPKGA